MQPTRAEYVERWRHELAGPLVDLLHSGATGAERSIQIAALYKRLNVLLGAAYDELTHKPPVPVNGAAKKP